MKVEEWMISEGYLDDKQYEIYMTDPDKSLIVAGSAGSGKTVLAVHRAKKMSILGSFVLLVFNKALKSMIEFGFKAQKLSSDSAIYAWAWENRGMDLSGLVFFPITYRNGNTSYIEDTVYLQKSDKIEVYKLSTETRKSFYDKQYETYLRTRDKLSQKEIQSKQDEISKFVSIDFSDYVSHDLYKIYGRRDKFYERTEILDFDKIKLSDRRRFESFSSAVIFVPYKFKVDYLVLDEAQDFNEDQIREFNTDYSKSILFFGDTNQKLSERGTKMMRIKELVKHQYVELDKNYRITKEIARVAEFFLPLNERTLLKRCNKSWGNPLPIVKKCKSIDDQIDFIIQTIKTEDLTDVGILVPTNKLVEIVVNKLAEKKQPTQYRFNKPVGGFKDGNSDFMHSEFGNGLYNQINNLNFQSTLPCVLTYHSAKGTQFGTVFVPFANDSMHSNGLQNNPFYVAITRASKSLYIIFEEKISSIFNSVPKDFYKSV